MPAPLPYPLLLNLQDRPVLVVGAGSVALRKTRSLLNSGARVTLVAPQIHPDLLALGTQHSALSTQHSPYSSSLMARSPRWLLVFATTPNPHVNAQVHHDAHALGILCARADDPDSADFANPAVHQTPDLTLAVSTHGSSPTLALKLRDQLASTIDPLLLTWIQLNAQWRPQITSTIPDPAARRTLLTRLAGPEIQAALQAAGPPAAQALFTQWLADALVAASPPSRLLPAELLNFPNPHTPNPSQEPPKNAQ